jgi:hypothetical protein
MGHQCPSQHPIYIVTGHICPIRHLKVKIIFINLFGICGPEH